MRTATLLDSVAVVPLCLTYSPILSATAESRPFSSVISFLTSAHAILSSLSTADEIVLIFSGGTPHTSKMPSKILRWFNYGHMSILHSQEPAAAQRTLMVNSPTSSRDRIVQTRLMISASGIMTSNEPAISKSCTRSL